MKQHENNSKKTKSTHTCETFRDLIDNGVNLVCGELCVVLFAIPALFTKQHDDGKVTDFGTKNRVGSGHWVTGSIATGSGRVTGQVGSRVNSFKPDSTSAVSAVFCPCLFPLHSVPFTVSSSDHHCSARIISVGSSACCQ